LEHPRPPSEPVLIRRRSSPQFSAQRNNLLLLNDNVSSRLRIPKCSSMAGGKHPSAPVDLRQAWILDHARVPELLSLADTLLVRGAGLARLYGVSRVGHALWDDLKRGNLTENVAHRGTTFNLYRDVLGCKGHHPDHLRVFLRAGKLCPGCEGLVVREKVGGHPTHFCPSCRLEDRREGEQGLTLVYDTMEGASGWLRSLTWW
jgi:hypothetical protein